MFVVTRNRMGLSSLFGPAPQSAYDSARPDDRQFSSLIVDAEPDAIEARLARESRFDSDIWVVELEPGSTPVEDLLNITTPDARSGAERLAERARTAGIVGGHVRLVGRRGRLKCGSKRRLLPAADLVRRALADGTGDNARGTA